MIENTQSAGDSESAKQGLAFLEGLESRHTQVLNELEDLNARIEDVLNSYARQRQVASSDSNQAEGGRVA